MLETIKEVVMYLASCTSLGISYPVERLSRYTSNLDHNHWVALDRLLKYLKGTNLYNIVYTGFPTLLERYSNVN